MLSSRSLFGCFLLVSLVGRTDPVRAQKLEEIVVTAQRWEEPAQDVPISLSVIGDELIARQSITDFRELVRLTPNAHLDLGNFYDVNIRGFGTPLFNKGFDQSVGIAVDGIPYGNAGYLLGPIFDLERVEVLRGPQGTLFGRNTTAGLLNVLTKAPTDEFTGFVTGELGDFERRRLEAAIGGPLVAGALNFRISALTSERDGLMENTTHAVAPEASDRTNGFEHQGIRLQLATPDLFGVAIRLQHERIDVDGLGVGFELHTVPQRTRTVFRQFDPDTDFVPGNHVGSTDAPEITTSKIQTTVLTAHTELGGWGLDAIAGHTEMKVRVSLDTDFTPAPMIFSTSHDDDPQTTFELRASSPRLSGLFGIGELAGIALGETELLLGAFYQQAEIGDSELAISLDLPTLAQFTAYQSNEAGIPTPPLDAFIGPAVQVGALGLLDTRIRSATTTMRWEQKTKSLAGFGHAKWRFLPEWQLQAGVRFTHETKDGDWNRTFSPGTGLAFAVLGAEEFTTSRERSESAWSPQVSLLWDWSADANLYASWKKGFKAGGLNEQSFTPTDESLEFDAEHTTAYEIGAKARFLDGAATASVALFHQVIADQQVLTVPLPSVATIVENAGEARARGFELDAAWTATDWLTLLAVVGFNDSEYLEFPLGQCSVDRPDTDGNGDGQCDQKGQPLFRTPKWASSVVASIRRPLRSLPLLGDLPFLAMNGIDLLAGGDAEWQDVQYLDRTYDPRVRQSPFFRFGGNLGFGNAEQGWTARVAVENLTDRDTAFHRRDIPLGGGHFAQIAEPQRLVFGSIRWEF